MNDWTKNNPMMEMFENFGKGMKLPTPDVREIMNFHRKNLEAFQAAMQAQTKGAQKAMARQREQLEEALAAVSDSVKDMSSGDVSGAMSNQMEIARKSFEMAIKNTTEMSEIARESSTESYNILRERMQDSMEEMRKGMTAEK